MSWVVENYIKRSLLIRSAVEKSQQGIEKSDVSDSWEYSGLKKLSSESVEDIYDDLLTIEIAIKKLHEDKLLSPRQIEIINCMSNGLNINQAAKKVHIHRETVMSDFVRACKTISDYLGEHFKLDGYIEYIVDKYHLDSSKEAKLRKYLESKNYTQYWRNNDKS